MMGMFTGSAADALLHERASASAVGVKSFLIVGAFSKVVWISV